MRQTPASPNPYASLRERIRASLIDGSIWAGWMVAAIFFPWPDAIPGAARFAIWIAPPVVAEPLFLWARRATVGQRTLGLRVAARPGRRFPSLPALYARHATKFLFGGSSLAFCLFAPRGEAIHDRLFGTVVLRAGVAQPAEPIRPDQGAVRRLLWMLWWLSMAALLNSMLLAAVAEALFPGYLASGDGEYRWLDAVMTLLLATGEGFVLHRGVSGRLPGLRENARSLHNKWQ